MRVKKKGDEGLIETRGSENGEKGFDQRVTDSSTWHHMACRVEGKGLF